MTTRKGRTPHSTRNLATAVSFISVSGGATNRPLHLAGGIINSPPPLATVTWSCLLWIKLCRWAKWLYNFFCCQQNHFFSTEIWISRQNHFFKKYWRDPPLFNWFLNRQPKRNCFLAQYDELIRFFGSFRANVELKIELAPFFNPEMGSSLKRPKVTNWMFHIWCVMNHQHFHEIRLYRFENLGLQGISKRKI